MAEQPGTEPPIGPKRVDLRARPARLRLAGAPIGIALALTGTILLRDANGFSRLLLTVGGLALLYLSVDTGLKAALAPTFPTAVALSAAWLGLILFMAVFADVLPFGEARNPAQTLRTPTFLRPDLFSEHPLGTDRHGLDILGQIAYGARVSLIVGFGGAAGSLIIGGLIGLTAGFYRGLLERGIALLTDTMLAFPPLILLLGLVAVLEANVTNVTIALAILSAPAFIRLVRANAIVYAQREFVLAARAMGAKNSRILFRELLPNVIMPAVSYALLISAVLIVAEASLSFLGLSIQRPAPTWGNMISAAQRDFQRHPHPVFVPGVALFLTVYALNRIGDAARRRWSPQGGQI